MYINMCMNWRARKRRERLRHGRVPSFSKKLFSTCVVGRVSPILINCA